MYSAGLAVLVRSVNTGRNVSAPSRQPVRMIGLRPMRSDSAPKIRKPPVPRISDQATMTLAVKLSTLITFCMKNSA
ncbi:hypothetical protein D3C87_2017140 [compost metagenome]